MIKERYAKDYGCAMRIRLYIKKNYQKEIGTEEITFLTVHLRRLSSSEV